MTFHPPWQDRVVYLIVLTVCAGLVLFCGIQVARGATSPMGSFRQPLAAAGVLLVVAFVLHRTAYGAFVKVTDQGIEWKDVTDQGSLRWDEIRGLSYKRFPKFVRPALVLKSSEELRFLPFFSPALYVALRDRVGRLPAEIERELKYRA